MPYAPGFIDATHPHMRSTVEAIERRLFADGLVYRYRQTDDGVPGRDTAFAACTFWLVENLVAQGQADRAAQIFEAVLARATPLGLFAEEIEPRTGAHLGNFPQALSHIALANAAVALAG
jgi:GH15 family glucan-1,4-alpha-glucosidase